MKKYIKQPLTSGFLTCTKNKDDRSRCVLSGIMANKRMLKLGLMSPVDHAILLIKHCT